MLCDTCLNIELEVEEVSEVSSQGSYNPASRTKGYKHYPSFYDLMESAKRQCDLCQLILAQFKRNHMKDKNLFLDT